MARDVESQTYQQAVADAVGETAAQVELRVLSVMVRRLREVAEGQGLAAAYAALNADMAEIEALLGEGAVSVFLGAQRALMTMAEDNDAWAAPFYEAHGVEQVASASDPALGTILSSARKRAASVAADSFTTSVLAVVDGDGVAHAMAERYRALVAQVATSAAMGDATREQAVRRAVRELSRGGCRVAYASGRTRDLYAAVRANVLAVSRETAQRLREEQGRQFGADGVKVSSHPNCAPDHRPYQGRVFTTEEFERLQRSLPRKIGEHNCRHRTSPVVVGVEPGGKAGAAERYDRDSAEEVEVTGLNGKRRRMTRYDATQYQRQVERRMRDLDRERRLMLEAGLEGDARELNARRRELRAAYRRLCGEAGVPEMMERTRWPS